MWWYNIGISCFAAAARVVAIYKPKVRLWVEGRRGIFERMAETIDPRARVVWVHAASLGEFEQGRPIIEAIRRAYPEYRILLTFFSPSGYQVRKNYSGADYVFYMPLDLPKKVNRFLDIVHPEIAIFIKYEFWLNYLTELKQRRCRTFIVSALFRRNSIFFRPYGGAFRRALRSFEHLFVQNETSRELLTGIGIRENVTVAGDTRFDRVSVIARDAKELPLIKQFAGEDPVFVAGSTWKPDEEILIPLFRAYPQLKFIVAPHEMEEQRIGELLAAGDGGAVRYTECSGPDDLVGKRVLVIDTIGILSSVYRYADYAYIGGGFGAGIHNTLEAATFGMPIAFGPNYMRFREAVELIAQGAAASVTSGQELEQWLGELVGNESLRLEKSAAAAKYVADNTGATRTILDVIFAKSQR